MEEAPLLAATPNKQSQSSAQLQASHPPNIPVKTLNHTLRQEQTTKVSSLHSLGNLITQIVLQLMEKETQFDRGDTASPAKSVLSSPSSTCRATHQHLPPSLSAVHTVDKTQSLLRCWFFFPKEN